MKYYPEVEDPPVFVKCSRFETFFPKKWFSRMCLKQIYKFGFDRFLETCTVFILIKKTLLKIKSCGFRPKNARCKKMLKRKIAHRKEIYNFYFNHFLIKRTVFVLIVKNVIKNQKFNFPDKLCEIRRKC